MAIDDPISAVETHLEIEALASDPVVARLAAFAEALGLPWPFGSAAEKIIGRVAADRLEKIELTLEVVKDEVRRHEKELQVIRKDPQRLPEWLTLLQDGLKKAEQTRAKSRVTRIGRILAKSLTLVPKPEADDVEEMMRTATQLSDYEVQLLNELVRIHGDTVRVQGRISHYDAYQRWPQGFWADSHDPARESAFAKLESFGLVSRLQQPNNQNVFADPPSRYALLRKGLDFIRSCAVGS
ncbi:MAG: hypothetical protein LAN36_06570 [Acidobacteriia bacterium]|nr:hypothetical protein [Terriglobia bacterium]